MSEIMPLQDAKKMSTNQQLKPHGEALVRELNAPPHLALNIIKSLDARLAAERLTTDEMAVVDATLSQFRQFRPVVQLNIMKVIAGELTEDTLGAHRAAIVPRFKTLIERYGAGALRVVLSNAEKTVKMEQTRINKSNWRKP
jgi:hypothetical protein